MRQGAHWLVLTCMGSLLPVFWKILWFAVHIWVMSLDSIGEATRTQVKPMDAVIDMVMIMGARLFLIEHTSFYCNILRDFTCYLR